MSASFFWESQSKASLNFNRVDSLMNYALFNQSGIRALVQQAIRARQISRQELWQLTSAMLSRQEMRAADRSYINRLLDCIRAGKIHLVD